MKTCHLSMFCLVLLAFFLGGCGDGEDPEAEAKRQRRRASKLEQERDQAQKQASEQRERTRDEAQRADSATSDFSVAFTASAILATSLALLTLVMMRQQRTKRCLSKLIRWMSGGGRR